MTRSKPLKRRKRLNPRRKRPRRTSVLRDPKRRAWARTQPCVGLVAFPGHHCGGYTFDRPSNEPSHIRDRSGAGMKPGDDCIVSKCPELHDQWEQRTGLFLGWSQAYRIRWASMFVQHHNARWEAYVAGREA